jgi:glycerol-3-phosphate cytidylyltransferase
MKICFDLDETICITPPTREYQWATPIQKMVDHVNKLYNQGHHITIFTARGSSSGTDYTELIAQQLEEWGVKHHEIVVGKPSYDVFIDDKAINTKTWREQHDIHLVGIVASCFDLLHAGHCLYLKEAKELCDHLIAGLQTNPADRPSKNKPVQSLKERRIQLEACRYVDEIFEYDTELDLEQQLEQIQPDIRFVGSDSDPSKITGKKHCKIVYFHDRNHDWSSSELRERIKSDNL